MPAYRGADLFRGDLRFVCAISQASRVDAPCCGLDGRRSVSNLGRASHTAVCLAAFA